METQDIERDIRSFIVAEFFFGRAEDLRDDGLLLGSVIDSTGVLALVSYLQEHFAIVVEDDEVVPDNLDSVQHVVRYVARKLNAAAQDRERPVS